MHVFHKIMSIFFYILLESVPEEKLPDATKLRRGKRQRSKASESSTDLSDVSPKKRGSAPSTESLEGQGDSAGSGRRKRRRRESEGEVTPSGESEDRSTSVRKGKKRKNKSMSDTSASESDVSKSSDVSGCEVDKKRKISQENLEVKTSGDDQNTKGESSDQESNKCDPSRRKRRGEGEGGNDSSPTKLPKMNSDGQSEETSKGIPRKKKEKKRKRKKKHKEKGLPELRVIPK